VAANGDDRADGHELLAFPPPRPLHPPQLGPPPPLTPRPASRAPGSSSRPPLPLHLAFAAVVSGTPSQLVRVPSEVVLAD
jgi:hypothetical protein